MLKDNTISLPFDWNNFGDSLLEVSEDLLLADKLLLSSIGDESISFSVDNLEHEMQCITDTLSAHHHEHERNDSTFGNNNDNIAKFKQGEFVDTIDRVEKAVMFDEETCSHVKSTLSIGNDASDKRSYCLSRRSKVETTEQKFLEVTSKDVLLGRGHGTSKHVGNQAFRDVVSKYKTYYMRLNKHKVGQKKNENGSKKILTKNILRAWTATDGRFLRMVVYAGQERWVEADTKEATTKIGTTLRQKEKWRVSEACSEAKLISAEVDAILRLYE